MISAFYSKNFAVVALFSFIAVAIFCVWIATAMSASGESVMNDCAPYGSEAVLCDTNAQNHISAWKNFLNAIPQKTFSLLLPALLLVSASAACKIFRPRAPEVARNFIVREYSTPDIIDPIKRALARGIIQPQIYNPVIG